METDPSADIIVDADDRSDTVNLRRGKVLSRKSCLAWIVPMIGLTVAPAHAQLCYISYVSGTGQGVALHFIPDSNVFVQISKIGQDVAPTDRLYQQEGAQMHRLQPNAQRPETAASRVVLSQGEEAFVSNGLHSACTIQPSEERSPTGVTMKAVVSLPGIPSQVTMRFLPLGIYQNNDAQGTDGKPDRLK